MITQAMKAALRAKGFSDDDIAVMTPGDAHKLLDPAPRSQTPKLEPFQAPASPPAELVKRKQWIGWRAQWDPVKGKFDKKPICIPTGDGTGFLKPGPDHHVDYDTAVAAVKTQGLSGIGFVLVPGSGITGGDLTGGDLDNCRDPETGAIEPWARAIVDLKETYCEISPSGKGVRFFALGELPLRASALTCPPARVELYTRGRFLTFSGKHIDGTPSDVLPAPMMVAALAARIKEHWAKDVDQRRAGKPSERAGAEKPSERAGAKKPSTRADVKRGEDDDAQLLAAPPIPGPSAGGSTIAHSPISKPGSRSRSRSHAIRKGPKAIGSRARTSVIPSWRKICRSRLREPRIGAHDMGDEREGKRSAIDLVIEWGLGIEGLDDPEALKAAFADPENVERAALRLAERLGIAEDELKAMGWRGRPPTLEEVKQIIAELQPKDLDGAKTIFDRYVRVKNRLPGTDDIVVSLVQEALGPIIAIESILNLLRNAMTAKAKAVEDRSELKKGANEGGPPRGFRVINGMLCRRAQTDDGIEWIPISSTFTVTAMLRDDAGSNRGVNVHFDDADGRPHALPLPAEIYGDPNALTALLTAEGLRLADAELKTRVALSTLLTKWSHPDRRTVASTPGWTHDRKAFLLGDGRVIGDQTVVLAHGRRDVAGPNPERGALVDWKVSVAALCIGNPVLLTSVSTAFAAMLLEVLNIESGIVHCRGDSSLGKTTAMRAGISVSSPPVGPVPSWRGTANGPEGMAASHNSILLPLDEVHLVSAKEAGAAALMLCNGKGKARANQRGDARAVRQWTTLVLSSGECSLADRIAEDNGAKITAGQEVRCLDLKVDGRPFGCFDNLHGKADGKTFAIHLANACARAYGTAGPAFVEFIMRTPDIVSRAEAVIAKFEARAEAAYGLADADAQVTRALRRFAVIVAAGELATDAGITAWPVGMAANAVLEMFGLWIGGRGGLMSAAKRNAIVNTRAFLVKNDSRLQKLVLDDKGALIPPPFGHGVVHDLAGWKDSDGFWISADAWRNEIHAGVDGQSAARALHKVELLIIDKNRGSRLTRRGPRSIERVQCYYVRKEVLATEQRV